MVHDDPLYTFIFTCECDDVGMIGVAIEGTHDVKAENFVPLAHKLIAVRMEADVIVAIEDSQLSHHLVWLVTAYLYLTEAEIVTSGSQILQTDADRQFLQIPGYGTVNIVPIGVVSMENETSIEGVDSYYLAIANPAQGVHLLIILQIIETSPLRCRAIDLEESLVEAIINRYLVGIGAVEDEDEEDENFH